MVRRVNHKDDSFRVLLREGPSRLVDSKTTTTSFGDIPEIKDSLATFAHEVDGLDVHGYRGMVGDVKTYLEAVKDRSLAGS